MAKAARTPAPKPRVPAGPTTDRVGYFKGVWEELRKVIWPTRTELWRMTGIVIATVVIFAALIGGADYGLGLVVKQLYTTSPGSKPQATPNTIVRPAVTAAPRTAPPITINP